MKHQSNNVLCQCYSAFFNNQSAPYTHKQCVCVRTALCAVGMYTIWLAHTPSSVISGNWQSGLPSGGGLLSWYICVSCAPSRLLFKHACIHAYCRAKINADDSALLDFVNIYCEVNLMTATFRLAHQVRRNASWLRNHHACPAGTRVWRCQTRGKVDLRQDLIRGAPSTAGTWGTARPTSGRRRCGSSWPGPAGTRSC